MAPSEWSRSDATSGPNGENPAGEVHFVLAPSTSFDGAVTCLAVRGNTATINFRTVGWSVAGIATVEVLDNRPDTFDGIVSLRAPTDCSPLAPTGLRGPLSGGDITVVDAHLSRMVGKGSVSGREETASYAYKLPCDAGASASARLRVRFGDQHFRLTGVDSAECTDDPEVSTPAAGFDTQSGTGTGTLTTGGPGTVEWKFVDGGRGGANDSVELTIRDASDAIVFQGSAVPPAPFPGSGQATGLNTAR